MHDLWRDKTFGARVQRPRDPQMQRQALEQLADTLVRDPSQTMQAFSEAALALCEADGAGVSLSCCEPDGTQSHCWGATSGLYAYALRAMLPSTMAACGAYLQQGTPQHCRGRPAPSAATWQAQEPMSSVTDGVLIPWAEDGLHGILWVTAHGRREAFDVQDARQMELLGSFIALYMAAGQSEGRSPVTGMTLTGGQLTRLIGELLELRLGPAPAKVLPFRG